MKYTNANIHRIELITSNILTPLQERETIHNAAGKNNSKNCMI